MAVLNQVENIENVENINEIIPGKKEAINSQSLKDKMLSYKRTPGSLLVMLLVMLASGITIVALAFLLGYILVNGVQQIYFPGLTLPITYRLCPQ